MKKKRNKIFIFVLLLCTIFSTLFVLTPNVKAVPTTTPPSDLTGYTVTVPGYWTNSPGLGVFNIIGYTIGTTEDYNVYFTSFAVGYSYDVQEGEYISSNNSSTFVNASEGIYDRYYIPDTFDFTCTGGTDATNQTLIQWFVDNNAIFDNGSVVPTTYIIGGGYQFYPTISSSIFGDTSEQELDILLEGNFWLYGNESVQWDMFTLHTLSSEDTALYFCYESSIFNKYNYVGQLINNNTQIQTYVGERTIYFEEQEVSEDVYNWLNNNGRFGNYDDTLPTPAPDNPFGFVVDMVNDFLQIEFLPGFKFIHLLYIAISVPLLMYILKLFLGG